MKEHGFRKYLACLAVGILAVGLAGCVDLLSPHTRVTRGAGGPGMAEALAAPYYGPKARLAVLAFDNKTGKGHRIGEGMAEMLTTELFNTNRYIMLERGELGGVLAEQDLATGGKVREETAVPTGQIEGAELLVIGAITEFEPNYQGSSGTITSRKYGSLTLDFQQARIGIDLRVVDSRTSRILATTSVTGLATEIGARVMTKVGGGKSKMGIGLGGYRKQPMEKAVRVCLTKAVQFVVSRTPQHYYHYDSSGQPLVVPAYPAQPAPGVTYAPPGTHPPAPQPPQPWEQPAKPAAEQLPAQVYVSLQRARVYQRPDASSDPVATVPRGAALRVHGARGHWYAVMLADGKTGWILRTFTTTTAPR